MPTRGEWPPGRPAPGRAHDEAAGAARGPALASPRSRCHQGRAAGRGPAEIRTPRAGTLNAAYLAYNHGKSVVEVDYRRPEGRAAICELASGADVFLHNWPEGRAARLGLDEPDIARVNPGIVYAHASGWGTDGGEGPCEIAGDFLVQGHAGCGEGLNPADEPATPTRLTILDVVGGLLACEGILAALYQRERTGRGGRVQTSLYTGWVALQEHVLGPLALGCEAGRRRGRPLWGPLDRPISTAAGFLVLDAAGEPARQGLAEVCGLRNRAGMEEWEMQVVERLRTRPAADWVADLRAAGVSAAAVAQDLSTLADDPRCRRLLERAGEACWVPARPGPSWCEASLIPSQGRV